MTGEPEVAASYKCPGQAPREHDNELKSIRGQGAGYRDLQEWSLLRGGESLCKCPGAVAGRCV